MKRINVSRNTVPERILLTDEEMEQYLKYDLIREKWNVLLDYYKNIYGIDLRAIANAQYK